MLAKNATNRQIVIALRLATDFLFFISLYLLEVKENVQSVDCPLHDPTADSHMSITITAEKGSILP
jgi:hypothetical protein